MGVLELWLGTVFDDNILDGLENKRWVLRSVNSSRSASLREGEKSYLHYDTK